MRERGTRRPLMAFASLALAPCVLRGLALVETGQTLALADLRGFLADLGVAALLLALLWPLAGRARWLAVVLVGALVLVHYANYETIAALGAVAALVDASYLGDRTFLFGSATAVAHSWLLAGLVVGSLLLAWGGLKGERIGPALGALGGGVLALAVLFLWPVDTRLDAWRQVNVVQRNAEWLALGRVSPPAHDAPQGAPTAAMLDLLPELRADVSAEPRFAFDGRGKNVLLVVLEGVSGAYVEEAARFHRRHPEQRLESLGELFRRNVGYATFVNHNRRTNRGLYALLCGELPGLVRAMPKMTVASSRPWQRCLPAVLRAAGYETAYLQAAPLAFMLKDQFMPTIGFERVHGHKWFEEYYLRTTWGVDDRAFFEQSMRMIESLEAGRKPWFLTLLTVGTHHPYVVPPPYGSPHARENARGAFRYLDLAVGEFMERVEASGIRDDTLILLASDEAAGQWAGTRDALAARLTQNWGFLTALLPERHQALVGEPYAQIDVPLSVLDYLGLADRGSHFFGRSLFRRYERGRHLFFGNVNLRTIGGFDPDGMLMHCEFEGRQCTAYDAFNGRLFGENLRELPAAPDLEALVVEMASRSRPSAADADLEVPLLIDERFTVDMREWQVVHGVAQIALEPDEWLEVDVEVEARGSARVELSHSLVFPKGRAVLSAMAPIEDGQSLRVHYTLAADSRITQLVCSSVARLVDGWKLDLDFKRRRFAVHRGSGRPPSGLRIESLELLPPSDSPGPGLQHVTMEDAEIERIAREMSPADVPPEEAPAG